MPKQNARELKLRRLTVRNYKALDSLEIEFPAPRMKGDPDIIVMGSRNGLGKTSVLESCALLFLGAVAGKEALELRRYREMPVNLGDLLVRAGTTEASIEGTFTYGTEETKLTVSISRPGKIQVRGDAEHLRHLVRRFPIPPMEVAERFIASLAALNAEPLVLPPLLYFHSYRKVQEGNPEIGMMVESERYHRRSRFGPEMQFPISTFKIEVLRSMMRRANLFEEFEREGDDTSSEEVFSTLNGLVERYAGGTIEKLRPSSDSTLDFRVTPTSGGKSFTFDGLSSGQKEIISTLFLIWRYTLHRPGIVLIDEPELHLNVEWHRGCVQQLHELAPANQYIVATHSEEVFASVQADRRRLLEVPETVTR